MCEHCVTLTVLGLFVTGGKEEGGNKGDEREGNEMEGKEGWRQRWGWRV
jgi:hypothetical protein